MNKGIIERVSLYGFKVEGDNNWHNFAKNRTQVFSENCKKHKGKEIEWEKDTNGLVFRVGLPNSKPIIKEESKEPLGLRIKGFSDPSLRGLTDQLNEFGTIKKIKATQTHIKGTGYIAFVWY
jgi:hypothetical protein